MAHCEDKEAVSTAPPARCGQHFTPRRTSSDGETLFIPRLFGGSAEHHEHHLEGFGGSHSVGDIGGQKDGLARTYQVPFSGDAHDGLAFQDMDHRVEWGRMLFDALALIKRKQRDRSGGVFDEDPAHDRLTLNAQQLRKIERSRKKVLGGLWIAHAGILHMPEVRDALANSGTGSAIKVITALACADTTVGFW